MHCAIAMWALLLLPAVPVGETVEPDAKAREVAYSIGYQVGGDFRRQGLKINPELVIQGVLDAMAGSEPRMSVKEMERALVRLQREAQAALERERRQQAPGETRPASGEPAD